VAVTGVSQTIGHGGFPEVQVQVKSKAYYRLKIKYLIDWYDPNHQVISSVVSQWKLIEVLAGEPFQIGGVAPQQNATTFRLQMRLQ